MGIAERSSAHRPGLFRASLHDGQAAWTRSTWQGIENNGGTENPDTAKATGATANAEKLIGHGGIGSLTMTEAGADSLLIYGFTAMMAHLSMSLGQTLFHRYLGHSRLGGRFFKNHIQFHHVHYAGNHVVSAHCLDNGDNNTLFFLIPVVLVVGFSYLFLRLDLLVVQLAEKTSRPKHRVPDLRRSLALNAQSSQSELSLPDAVQ